MDLQNDTEFEQESIKHFTKPAHLCLKCGICCKVAVPSYSHEEISKMADEDDPEAIAFLSIFEPYSSFDDIPEEGRPHFDQIIKTLSRNDDFDINNITVYRCKYIDNDKNICTIYEKRPQCCRRAPSNGWSLFQPNCGYKGWQFQQREFFKQQVRILKETLYEIELVGDKNTTYLGMNFEELKEYFNKKIAVWDKYGAKYW